jgi:HAD superfamily hydrolase (TIGR01458 family)
MVSGASLAVDGLLLDMDGVLAVSQRPVPGAVEALARLRARGVPSRVLTSTTSYTRAALGAGLRGAGFEIADDEVLTAAGAAAAYLRARHPDARVFCLGDARHEELAGVRLVGLADAPDVVLVSGADASFTFANLNGVYREVLRGATLVAMHRNLSWMTAEGECLDAGAYLLGLERAAGREAVVTGKPASEFFAVGLRALGLPAGRVAMVGDDVENDVLAAQRLGILGVLVRTGKFRDDALAAATGTPDVVIASIADVPDLLGC